MSTRFPDVDWYCDECGHDNPISQDVIFDPWEFLANFDLNKFARS